MVIEGCGCNWGIPGVAALPTHHHPSSRGDTYEPTVLEPDDPRRVAPLRLVPDPWQEPYIWVDWRAIARALRIEP